MALFAGPIMLLPAGATASTAITLSQVLQVAGWGLLAGSVVHAIFSRSRAEGPRLTEFNVPGADYGRMIPIAHGRARIPGNTIWAPSPRERRAKIRQRVFFFKKTVGTRHEYYASWQVMLCKGPIERVTRIWANNTLIFDITAEADSAVYRNSMELLANGAKPPEVVVNAATGDVSVAGPPGLRIYPGSEAQAVDPLIQYFEGTGNVPAYSRRAHIVFQNWNLTERFRNAVPVVSAEVSEAGEDRPVRWDEERVGWYRDGNFRPSLVFSDRIVARQITGANLTPPLNEETWLVRSPDGISQSPNNSAEVFLVRPVGPITPTNQGEAYISPDAELDEGREELTYLQSPLYHFVPPNQTNRARRRFAIQVHAGEVWYYGGRRDTSGESMKDLWRGGLNAWTRVTEDAGAGARWDAALVSFEDELYLIGGNPQDASPPNAVYRLEGSAFTLLVEELTGEGASNAEVLGAARWRGRLIALVKNVAEDDLYLLQSSDGVNWLPYHDRSYPVAALSVGQRVYWVAGDKRDEFHVPSRVWIQGSTGNDGLVDVEDVIYDSETIRTGIKVETDIADDTADGTLYHYGIVGKISAAGMTRADPPALAVYRDELYVAGAAASGTDAQRQVRLSQVKSRYIPFHAQLQTVVSGICALAGLPEENIDVDELEGMRAIGHAITEKAPGRDHLIPLQRAFHFDAVSYDGALRFKRRGRQPITVPEGELQARPEGGADTPKLELIRVPDVSLPRTVELTYSDLYRDYEANTVSASHPGTGASGAQSVSVAAILEEKQAQQAVDVLLWDLYAERMQAKFYLPRKWDALVPTDVVRIDALGAQHDIRVTRTHADRGLIQVEGVFENLDLYRFIDPPQPGVGPSGPQIILAGLYRALIDTVALSADHDDYGFLFAAAPVPGKPWGGAALYRRVSDEAFERIAEAEEPCVMGYALTELTAPANPWLIDKANTLDVYVASGEPESVMPDALLYNANLCIVGNEIIQFAHVEPLGERIYRLSHLMRGRFGTEWAIETHEPLERFVALDNAVRVPLDQGDVGVAHDYRVVDPRNPVEVSAMTQSGVMAFASQGVAKMPISPVHIQGTRDPLTGMWRITWIRRSRLGWGLAWGEGGDAPLAEEKEEYEIDFLIDDEVAHTVEALFVSLAPQAPRVLNLPVASAEPSESRTIHGVEYIPVSQEDIFGGAVDSLYLRIYQIASDGRRGFPAEAIFEAGPV